MIRDTSASSENAMKKGLDSPSETVATVLHQAAESTLLKIQKDLARVSPKIVPLLRCIESELFDGRLTVASLKRACGVRANSLTVAFHRELGDAPKAYIMNARLETAARLLANTNFRVWQIAEMVGFSGLGVFSKAFNRWAKMRPKAYRDLDRKLHALPQGKTRTFNGATLRRAVAGTLPNAVVMELLSAIARNYPEVFQTMAGSLENQS